MKHLRKILAVALVALSLVAVALPAMAVSGLAPGTGYESHNNGGTGSVNVRNSASASNDDNIAGRVNTGTALRINYESGSWYNIDVLGTPQSWGTSPKTGRWIQSQYVRKVSGSTNPGTGTPSFGIGSIVSIKGTSVNARTGPGTNYTVAFVTKNGEDAEVIGTANSFGELWVWLEFPGRNFANGWVRSDYLQ